MSREHDDSDELVEISSGRPVRLVDDGATTEVADDYVDNPGSIFASEFDAELHDRAASHYGPDGQPVDDVDAAIQLRDRQRAREHAISPSTSINPASWDRGTLGQTVELKPGPTADAPGQRVMAAYWSGDDREVCPVTVTVAPAMPLPAGIVRPVATVQWGVHGARYQADVDAGTGTELTISASSVYVSLYLDAGSTVACTASASIGFYSSNRTSPVTRTAHLTFTASGNVTVPRPAFAATVAGFESDDPAGLYTLMLVDGAGTIVGVRAGVQHLTAPIVLPDDVIAVVVSGTGAARLIFGMF